MFNFIVLSHSISPYGKKGRAAQLSKQYINLKVYICKLKLPQLKFQLLQRQSITS